MGFRHYTFPVGRFDLRYTVGARTLRECNNLSVEIITNIHQDMIIKMSKKFLENKVFSVVQATENIPIYEDKCHLVHSTFTDYIKDFLNKFMIRLCEFSLKVRRSGVLYSRYVPDNQKCIYEFRFKVNHREIRESILVKYKKKETIINHYHVCPHVGLPENSRMHADFLVHDDCPSGNLPEEMYL